MPTLWIIRHGQASFGEADYDKLSDLGSLQSQILGRYLKKTRRYFDGAYSGTMKRQIDTAHIVGDGLGASKPPLEIEESSAFDEYAFKPIFEALLPDLLEDEPEINTILPHILKDNRKFQTVFGKIVDRWVDGRHEAPGFETYRMYHDRVIGGLTQIANDAGENDTLAVFTSAGVVSMAMKMALGLSDKEAMRLAWWVKNTSVTVISYTNGRFNLINFNNLSHLELENRPDLLTYR